MALEGEVAAGLTLHEATTTGIHGVGAGTIVGTTLAQTLTNKTLTTPVIASLYQDAAKTLLVTMPAASDTLVGKATTDVLTNKTLTSPTINGTIATTGLTMPAITLGGAVTLGGQVFDAGAGTAVINTTGEYQGLAIVVTNAGHGGQFTMAHVTSSKAVGDRSGIFTVAVNGATWGTFELNLTNVGAGTEAAKWIWIAMDAGGLNTSMELSGAGLLSVDVSGTGTPAQVDLFDQYDDALVLRQGIQQNNRELLADMGVLTRKDTGSGYMMNLQSMIRLLAGGIYQTRVRLDQLSERLGTLELALPQGGKVWQSGLGTR